MRRLLLMWLLVWVVAGQVGPAEASTASSCDRDEFLLSGTVIDEASRLPLSVATEVVVLIQETPNTFSDMTFTVPPSSTYEICLPASLDGFTVGFLADGYVFETHDDERNWADATEFGGAPGGRIAIDAALRPVRMLLESELFFFRRDGLYRAYDPSPRGRLSSPLVAGEDWPHTGHWQYSGLGLSCTTPEGDDAADFGMFTYGPNGTMYWQANPVLWHQFDFDPGADFQQRLGAAPGWDVVAGIDLLQQSILFYSSEGAFQIRSIHKERVDEWPYQPCGAAAVLDLPFLEGRGYTSDWTLIVPIDLDGDGDDELLFYRSSDGLFRYYDIRRDGTLPRPMLAGDGYTTGWDSIAAVDLDGDRQDEIMFYRSSDGLFRYYHIRRDGTLPRPMLAGDGYTTGWDSIAAFESCQIDGVPAYPCR